MRIGENPYYMPTYAAREKQATAAAPGFAAGEASSTTRAPERDQSATGLKTSLWQMQAGIYFDKDAEEVALTRDALRSEFQEESRKSLAERIRDQYLEDNGLTEEALAEMPKEDREAIEDEIAALIKRQYGLEDAASDAEGATSTL